MSLELSHFLSFKGKDFPLDYSKRARISTGTQCRCSPSKALSRTDDHAALRHIAPGRNGNVANVAVNEEVLVVVPRKGYQTMVVRNTF